MTTAAKRARKKANKMKGWPEFPEDFVEVGPPEEQAKQIVSDLLDSPTATESEHAAARQALARVKKMRNMRNRKASE